MGGIWQQALPTRAFTFGTQRAASGSENGALKPASAWGSITKAISWHPPVGTGTYVCGSSQVGANSSPFIGQAPYGVLARMTSGWLPALGTGAALASISLKLPPDRGCAL